MKFPDRIFAWDVLIVSEPGRATELAGELKRDLLQRRLRVQIHALPSGSPLPLSKEAEQRAAQAAICIALATRPSEGGDDRVAYAIMPAPRFVGQRPTFSRPGAKAKPNEIDIGMIEDDLSDLASRIAGRIQGARG